MNRLLIYCSLLFAAVILWQPCALARDLRVQAAVEKNRVYVGEPFILQIQVDGADDPEQPDIGPLTDFNVTFAGGQQNDSQSISIINGNMTRVSQKGYIFNFQLSAKKRGELVIPALPVKVDGQTLYTEPVTVAAIPPEQRSDLKLRLSFSKKEAYVGEPVRLKVTWYIGKSVNGFSFNLPVLDDPRFDVEIPSKQPGAGSANELVKVPLGNRQVLAVKGMGQLDGRQFTTVSFSLILFPKKAGTLTLPGSTVSCQVFAGYHQMLQHDPFGHFFQDNLFNNFFNQGMGQYETAVVPANAPQIHIKSLPTAGRPASFTGLVGVYSIATQATPTKVHIGDPITLTILVTGPPYLDNVELPPLRQLPAFQAGFKIPDERAEGQVQGRSKVFTQTIRAKRTSVTRIPPVELSFFNTETGRYETARSEAIPLTVEKTKIITAQDAEGGIMPAVGSELTSQNKGIAQNYEGRDALQPQTPIRGYWALTRAWLLLLLLPPLFFGLYLLGYLVQRQRQKDPAGLKARKALPLFLKEIRQLPAAPDEAAYLQLASALRRYLGSRLQQNAVAITYADVEACLVDKGVPAAVCDALRTLFDVCEAARYGGAASQRNEDWLQLRERATSTVRQLDKVKL